MSVIELAALILCVVCSIIFGILRWEPRIPIGVAIALLAATAITLMAGNENLADHFAVWAFYSFAAGMVLLLVQYIRKRRLKD